MDRIFVRNYTLFFLILVAFSGSLVYVLITGDRAIDQTNAQVELTNTVITEAQELSALIEGMIAAQRGHALTKSSFYTKDYETKRNKVSNNLADLNDLLSGSNAQISRLDEIRHHFGTLSTQLERPNNASEQESIDSTKGTILRINGAILQEEYNMLNERVRSANAKKTRYFTTLLIGVILGSAMLLLFNGFLLHAQRKRSRIEDALKDTEERFALAIEGTQDGIFDWNIKTGEVFYSKQFFKMLGYDKAAHIGQVDDYLDMVHPDDLGKIREQTNLYLNGELSEYYEEFRVKAKSGRYIWIQSRAKAIFNKYGQAVRMVGAHTDITYMKEYQERLKNEKRQAEDANRAKSDFLAHMSHEIRTPLTAVSGIAEIFANEKSNLNDKQKKLVCTLNSSTALLQDLINDILDFSKIESGELELEDRQFNLGEVFEEVISIMSVRANEKGINFVFDHSEVKDQELYGDQVRLRQILINLIGNALKFTEKGSVTVKAFMEARGEQKFLRVDVTDTGIGIAQKDFELIFERFKQADSSVSRKYGGTGLGLPISKNLAKLMNGNITLRSEPGKGSTFSLIIPAYTQEQGGDVTEQQLSNKKLTDKIKASIDGEKRILMVEDYEGNVVVLSYILEELGCVFDVAKTGREAVNLWKEHHYNIVLMDIQMPEMDGFAATKEIRNLESKNNMPRTPIIGMTAHALVGDKDKCIAAGMDAYLPKPIVETDLKKQILKFLNQKNSKAA